MNKSGMKQLILAMNGPLEFGGQVGNRQKRISYFMEHHGITSIKELIEEGLSVLLRHGYQFEMRAEFTLKILEVTGGHENYDLDIPQKFIKLWEKFEVKKSLIQRSDLYHRKMLQTLKERGFGEVKKSSHGS